MAWETLEALTTRVIQKLSQVPGTAVQTYSEDRIQEIIKDQYLLIARDPDYWWPQFRYRTSAALDGSTGQVTSTLSAISRGEDILAVYYSTDQIPIPQPPANSNPATFVMAGRVIEFDGSARFFTIYPLTETGTVYIKARSIPLSSAIDSDTEIKFDDQYIVHISAWDYLMSDGDNPGDAAKMEAIAMQALNRVKKQYNKQVISLDGTLSAIPTSWEYR